MASYPSFTEAETIGVGFESVNEHRKIQITDYVAFPDPVKRLADALASPEFISQLETLTGINNLLWDENLVGGGIHQTASSGLLDVHVDFNLLERRQMFRRLNLLIYLNPVWDESWGGMLELWDANVSNCHLRVTPGLGNAVLFETSDISFHGVTAVQCPEGVTRKSFAAYYYTAEAPPSYTGRAHSTVFKARPNERMKRYVQMPVESIKNGINRSLHHAKTGIKKKLGLSRLT
ncbi:MAG: 2OG-Fe(II) oxygenase [Myxococcales bacterium]|nr:2OG-Fe(II) oxygenase [Myxococcales bacterium]